MFHKYPVSSENNIHQCGRGAEDPHAEAHHAVKRGGAQFAHAFLFGPGVIHAGFEGVLRGAKGVRLVVKGEDGGAKGDEWRLGSLGAEAEAEIVDRIELLDIAAAGERLAAKGEFLSRQVLQCGVTCHDCKP